jgi:hypothetical protein
MANLYEICITNECSPPVFTLTYPVDNVFEAPPGTNTPNVSDGYWVMLEPLRPGAHTLYSRGEFTDGSFRRVSN